MGSLLDWMDSNYWAFCIAGAKRSVFSVYRDNHIAGIPRLVLGMWVEHPFFSKLLTATTLVGHANYNLEAISRHVRNAYVAHIGLYVFDHAE